MKSFKQFIKESSGTIEGVHYSHIPNMTHVDTSKYGTGIKGAEARRLEDSPDDRIKHRSYFYNKTGADIPKPESNLGPHIHKAELHNIYNPSTASESEKSVVLQHKEKHLKGWNHPSNAFESGVLDAGYKGYTNSNMTVVLGKQHVPVSYHGSSVNHQS